MMSGEFETAPVGIEAKLDEATHAARWRAAGERMEGHFLEIAEFGVN